MKHTVFDASALLAYMNKDDGWEVVEGRIFGGSHMTYLHCLHASEMVYWMIEKQKRQQEVLETFRDFRKYGWFQLHNGMSEEVWRTAALYKAEYGIGMSDCFALALATKLNADVMTADEKRLGNLHREEGAPVAITLIQQPIQKKPRK